MSGDDRWVDGEVEKVRCLVRDTTMPDAVTAACGEM